MTDETPLPPQKKKRGPPKGVRFAGRQKGSKNKATLEREAQERVAREAAVVALQQEAQVEVLERRGTPDSERAKKVLETFMKLFAGMATYYQPLPPGVVLSQEEAAKRAPDPALFKEYASLTVETAKALAPFQDPRFSAVMVAAAVVTKIEISGGMPNDFEAKEDELAPGTIISADDDPGVPSAA